MLKVISFLGLIGLITLLLNCNKATATGNFTCFNGANGPAVCAGTDLNNTFGYYIFTSSEPGFCGDCPVEWIPGRSPGTSLLIGGQATPRYAGSQQGFNGAGPACSRGRIGFKGHGDTPERDYTLDGWTDSFGNVRFCFIDMWLGAPDEVCVC